MRSQLLFVVAEKHPRCSGAGSRAGGEFQSPHNLNVMSAGGVGSALGGHGGPEHKETNTELRPQHNGCQTWSPGARTGRPDDPTRPRESGDLLTGSDKLFSEALMLCSAASFSVELQTDD